MSLDDLKLILKKDPIIDTLSLPDFCNTPESVEHLYLKHARTHLSLGDTEKHVNTIFRWIGSNNQGTFIGAVVGNYGEGKTSFLVHVWSKSEEQKIFAIPPHKWERLRENMDAVAAWVRYILSKEHPELQLEAERVYKEYKEKSIDELAEQHVRDEGGDLDAIKSMYKLADEKGHLVLDLTPSNFLDYCEKTSNIVKKAGYIGLLVLIDEPEVAKKKLGGEKVAHLLFELADELRKRQGNYGIFLSMPENFLAEMQRSFSSLTARLQHCKCFPRLKDVYGPDFAIDLWDRYCEEYQLQSISSDIVSNNTLKAISQLGSSRRFDISYGPRTVISSFNYMIYNYQKNEVQLEPEDFVESCLQGSIMLPNEYSSKVRDSLDAPEIGKKYERTIKVLAAYPDGVSVELLENYGLSDSAKELSKRVSHIVYKRMSSFGLTKLLKSGDETSIDPLKDALLDLESEFAPTKDTFRIAVEAFYKEILPEIFKAKQGQQLLGWEIVEKWVVRNNIWSESICGAFSRTEKEFPKRYITITITSCDSTGNIVCEHQISGDELFRRGGPLQLDALLHFQLRWNEEQGIPSQTVGIDLGNPQEKKPAIIRYSIDLLSSNLSNEPLEKCFGSEKLTPFFILYLIGRMRKYEGLPKEATSGWEAIKRTLIREINAAVFTEKAKKDASEAIEEEIIESGKNLLGNIFLKVLRKRYPEYSTLIATPQWEKKVDTYINALGNNKIPLSCKRGNEEWSVPSNDVAKILGTNRMNLDAAFSGFENIIEISKKGRDKDVNVKFKLHPLEETIGEMISAQKSGADRKMKIDGRECWWMPWNDVVKLIMTSGYSLAELVKIVEIAKTRGSFDISERRGEKILYRAPLDIPDMKKQLLTKIDDLKAEFVQLERVQGFRTSFDIENTRTKIESLENEVQYDNLLIEIHKQFESNHRLLPGYFKELAQGFNQYKRELRDYEKHFTSSREVKQNLSHPKASSSWACILSEYIITSLNAIIEELTKSLKDSIADCDRYINKFTFMGPKRPGENINLLLDGQQTLTDLKEPVDSLKSKVTMIFEQLKDCEEWRKLLVFSDVVFSDLVELKKGRGQSKKAQEFLSEHKRISDKISEHLELRNISGLSSHRQFYKEYEKLKKKKDEYIRNIKSIFDKKKDALNQVLGQFGVERVSIAYNPTASEEVYHQLFERAAECLKSRIIQNKEELLEWQRELRYALNILKVEDETAINSSLEDIKIQLQTLQGIEGIINTTWFENHIKKHDSEDTNKILENLKAALKAISGGRKAYKEAVLPTKIPDTAQYMWETLPDNEIDLKEIILKSDGEDPEEVLEKVLKSLVDLFRSNHIQIKLSKTKPHN